MVNRRNLLIDPARAAARASLLKTSFALRAQPRTKLQCGFLFNRSHMILLVAVLALFFLASSSLLSQENYEIQVYPSETQSPGTLLAELHSNYTVEGSTAIQFGMLPTQGQEHETVELTQGINNWSEVGFYVFTEEHSGTGVQRSEEHIRPRVRVPPSWHWPVGVSLSNEIGYARAVYATRCWD